MKFNKFLWVYELPEVFENGVLSTKRLNEISAEVQKKFIFLVMRTLMQYFNCSDAYTGSSKNLTERAVELECQIVVWLSGLCGTSVAQIIYALDDILELRTDYQKFPPKSVMEFYTVCKRPRPAYHDVPQMMSNAKQLGWDKESARARTEKIAYKCLKEIFIKLGKDYEKIRDENIKNGVYGKHFKNAGAGLKNV